MDVRLSAMRTTEHCPWAGAHSSDGWEVDTPWHIHDMHQLLYAFEGSVEVEGQSARYKVPNQFAVWIPAGTVHRTTIQKVRSGSIFLTPDMIEAAAGSPRVVSVPSLMREMIMYAMRWPLERSPDDTSTTYFKCFAGLCAQWVSHEVNIVLPASADKRIDAIMSYTRCNIAAVTLPDVCQAAGMSERSLRRHFKTAVGMPWEEFRQRQRICLAIDALDNTTKSVGTIAADVGYENQAAFAKAFRVVMGVGPTEYRKSKQ